MSPARCIAFPNKDGQLLHGILHEPDSSVALGVCVLLLSPGIKGRVGPHRLYLKIAARLAPMGFHVLRFDYHGLGDSEGVISERMLVDMYNTIHGGRYVGDTIAAMDWMQERLGVRRFVGSGLCGGSISALLSAAQDPRIECLLGIGLPTALDGGPDNWGKSLTSGQLETLRRGYLRNLLDPRSWLRLLSGKTNYAIVWRSLRRPSKKSRRGPTGSAPPAADNANPRFAPAFRRVIEAARPMLLIFSGNDRLHDEFQEKFEARNPDLAAHRDSLYEIALIPNANHILSDQASVAALLDHAERWLTGRYRHRSEG